MVEVLRFLEEVRGDGTDGGDEDVGFILRDDDDDADADDGDDGIVCC